MKGYFEDIKPMTRRQAVPQKEQPAVSDAPQAPREMVRERRRIPPTPFEDHSSHWGWGRIFFTLLCGLVLVAGAIYGLSYLFRGATVEITPKSVAGTVNLNLTATSDGSAGIQYQLMTVPETETQNVTATNTTLEANKATGTVVLYNFQSVAQKITATTRFADGNGTIFRLQSAVTIPKETSVKGAVTPGQATVTLVADAAGPAGNIPLSDFTVAAYNGTAKAKLVYGRGKTAFTGGTSGPAYYLSQDEYTTAMTALATDIAAKLHDESYKQVPQGYVLLSDSLTFIPDPDALTVPPPSTSPDITVSYTGKMQGVLLKKSDLETAFIANIDPTESVTPDQVTIAGEDALAYQSNAASSNSTSVPATISISIKGDVTLVWNIDQSLIKDKLAGTSRHDFTALMQTFSSIKQADLVLEPFWMMRLPTSQNKIKIDVDNPVSV